MSTLVKGQNKGQVTIPTAARKAASPTGHLKEASFRRDKIILPPKLTIDRSQFPTADDEYTPEQRRFIDARLAESEDDIKRRRTFGPFNTAAEMIEFLHSHAKKARAKKTTKPRAR